MRSSSLLLLTAASFGAAPALISVAGEHHKPWQLAALRAGLGLPCLILAAALFSELRWPSRTDRMTAAIGGVLIVAIPFVTMAAGLRHVPSGLGGVLYSAMPLFTFALSAVFLDDEPLDWRSAARIAVGLAGVCLIAGPQIVADGLGRAGLGALLVLLAPLSYAMGGVWLRMRPPARPLLLGSGMFAVGAALTAPIALVMEGPPRLGLSSAGLPALLALVVLATALPAVLNYLLVRRAGANRAALVMFLMPGFAVVYGAVFLGERLDARTFAGLALVIAASWRRDAPAPVAGSPPSGNERRA